MTQRGAEKRYECDVCGTVTDWLDQREHVPIGWSHIQSKISSFGWARDQWRTDFMFCEKCTVAVLAALRIAVNDKTALSEILAQFSRAGAVPNS